MNKQERRKLNRELHKEGKHTHGQRVGLHKQTANNLLRIGKGKEQRRQSLQDAMLTASTLAERHDAKKALLGSANVHMGNKLTKPAYLWNPDGKKQAMTKVK